MVGIDLEEAGGNLVGPHCVGVVQGREWSGRDFVGKTRNTNTALPVLKVRSCVFEAFCNNCVVPTGLASNRSVARSSKRYSAASNRATSWGTLATGSNTYF